jgi:hypothetical protein
MPNDKFIVAWLRDDGKTFCAYGGGLDGMEKEWIHALLGDDIKRERRE